MKQYFVAIFIVLAILCNTNVSMAVEGGCCLKKPCDCVKSGCCKDGACTCKGDCCANGVCKCASGACGEKCTCKDK